ncbi:hypothetical protein MXB_2641, partial [Myxobolus squamalis]
FLNTYFNKTVVSSIKGENLQNLTKEEKASLRKSLKSVSESRELLNLVSVELKRQGDVLSRNERNLEGFQIAVEEAEGFIDKLSTIWKRFINLFKKLQKQPKKEVDQQINSNKITESIKIESNDIIDELNKNLIEFKIGGLAIHDELSSQNEIIDRFADSLDSSKNRINIAEKKLKTILD